MSKLLISCATLGSGGAERVISILSRPFADYFDEVVIVMWLRGSTFYKIDKRVRIVCLPDISGISNRYLELGAFRKVVRKEKPDVILSFLTPFNVLVVAATCGLKIPVIVCERTDPDRVKGVARLIRNIAYCSANGILTQTNASKWSFKGSLYGKTSVIYNPVIMNEEFVGSAIETPKERLVVSAGRLVPVKNQRMMIDAFKLVCEKHPDYKMKIYGEGAQREALQAYINSRNLKDSVFLPGNKDDIWKYLRPAQVFLLTSNYEGMPNAMLEAMCLGLPCVSTKIKSAEELITNGYNGLLVDFNDAVSLSEKICYLIDNPDKALEIGRNSVDIYRELQEDVISKEWISYLKKIIGNSRKE